MKLIKSLTLLLLVAKLGTTYGQYPVIRKIGKDSLVLITVKQAEQINKQFDSDKKTIVNLTDSLKKVQQREIFYREMSLRRQRYEDSLVYRADTFALKYRVATDIYKEEEQHYRKYFRNAAVFGVIVTFFIMILGSQK